MARKKKQSEHQRSQNTGFSVALWVLAFIAVLGLFVAFLPRIRRSLIETDFFSHIKPGARTEAPSQDGDVNSAAESKDSRESGQNTAPPATPQTEEVTVVPQTSEPVQPPAYQPPAPQPPAASPDTRTAAPAAPRDRDAPPVAAVPSGQIQLRVWFVEIHSDGSVSRKEIARASPATDSPLSAAVRALLGGPSASERGKGCDTLIPEGTRLLSAAVKNGVATLSFSDEFQYNRNGVEGYMGQLMQVVYTATAFPTVDSVQFLIEGEWGEYIGSEGVWIGSPLSRSSFR